jgi:prepilin peptidase CpaA
MHNVMDPFLLTRLLLVVTLTLLAAMNDVRYQRIPNVLIGTFLSLGVLAWVEGHGVIGLWYSLGPSVLILLLLLPLFVLRAFAGGDIKLFAAIAGITGIELFIPIFILSLLAGGIVGLMIWLRRRPTISWAQSQVFAGTSLESETDHSGIPLQDHRFPFGVPIFMGTVLGLLGDVHVAAWL